MKTNLLFSSFPFMTSDKVTLCRMTEPDLPALWPILGDEENYRFMPTAEAKSQRECGLYLRQAEQLFKERRAVFLGIYPAQGEHRLIGVFHITDIDPQVECATLSLILHPLFTGQGYASGALRTAVDYLMGPVELRRLQAYVMPTNYRAVLALERSGFQKEGTIREGFYWPDKGIVDLSVYSLLPSDRRPKGSGQTNYF